MITYTRSGDIITISYEGNTYPINKDHPSYTEIRKALTDKKYDIIPKLLDVEKKIETATKGRFRVSGNTVFIDEKQVDNEIGQKIVEFMRAKAPHKALIKFWENVLLNPDPVARKSVFPFIKKNGHPITEDGCFIAYKSVRSDYRDHHTGRLDYNVGNVVKEDRAVCDPNPKQTCSKGLHVANRHYAWGFNSSKKMIECKINPRDVVAVPDDYSNMKMRTCEVYVVRDNDSGQLKVPYIDVSKAVTHAAQVASGLRAEKSKRRTFYRIVNGKIETIRRTVCPTGFSETKPIPKSSTKKLLSTTSKQIVRKAIKKAVKKIEKIIKPSACRTYYHKDKKGKISTIRATSCPVGYVSRKP